METEELWAIWVTAGATILAAVVPAVLFLLERKDRKSAEHALSVERTSRAAADERRIVAQRLSDARKIVGWFDYRPTGPGWVNAGGETHYAEHSLFGVVQNASDSPVFDVALYYFESAAAAPNGQTADVPSEPVPVKALTWRVVAPGDRSEGTCEVPRGSGGAPRLPLDGSFVEYKDADGTRWRRFPRGLVIENPKGLDGLVQD